MTNTPFIKNINNLDTWYECTRCGTFVTDPLRHVTFHKSLSDIAHENITMLALLDQALFNGGPVSFTVNEDKSVTVRYKDSKHSIRECTGATLEEALKNVKYN